MNFGITKTIPASAGQDTVDALYDGSLSEYEFHMAGSPSKLKVGHYVYTIFGNQVISRLHKSRDIGLPRTRLQHLATAAAINLFRVFDWLSGERPSDTPIPSFVALAST